MQLDLDREVDGLIIELELGANGEELLRVIQQHRPYAKAVSIRHRTLLVCEGALPETLLAALPGIRRTVQTTVPYPLCSKAFASTPTTVQVGPVCIGGRQQVIIGGPCSVESLEQIMNVANHLVSSGCQILRGGAFKPRTSPYSFQGYGEEGLKMLAAARAATGLPFVTEVLSVEDLPVVAGYADMLQIGARNMQNFPLLRAAGRSGKPVMLKRAPGANLQTWLQAAEYLLVEGNDQVVLCERGITASDAASGRHLDLAGVLQVRKLTHLPVLVDSSHGTGQRDLVIPLSLAALVTGADGLMVEVHPEPDAALSDGKQSLDLHQFDDLMQRCRRLWAAELDVREPSIHSKPSGAAIVPR